jgi:pimeloyl-ACP methyl ester carboxylesterase
LLATGTVAPCYSQAISFPAPERYIQPAEGRLQESTWSGPTSTCVTQLGLVDLVHRHPRDTFTLPEKDSFLSSDLRRLRRRLAQRPMQNYEFLGLFNPEIYAARAGVYAIDPYQPGKIPVVLVHGIWSGPKVWAPMLDALCGDPELRATYQFWVVLYPSCYPLPIAALSLRQSLREIRQRFDPRGTDHALDQMVIVGKSTGGQVTRMLVEPSGELLWNAIFTRPIDQVRARPELLAQLAEAFFFQPEPSVRRVIFVATAHRGNQAGAHPLARFGVGLIQRNNPLCPIWAELEDANGEVLFQPHLRNRALSSADGLEAENPMLIALAAQPISREVAFHSIIANIRHKNTPEKICDGVVDYRSAHLDGAASERIVTATHICEADSEVIGEVQHILHVHLAEQNVVSP